MDQPAAGRRLPVRGACAPQHPPRQHGTDNHHLGRPVRRLSRGHAARADRRTPYRPTSPVSSEASRRRIPAPASSCSPTPTSPRRSSAPRRAGPAHVSPRAVADRQPVPCRATASACIWSANRRRHFPRCQASIRSRSAASSRRDSSFPSRRSSPRANPCARSPIADSRTAITAPCAARRSAWGGREVARLRRGRRSAPSPGARQERVARPRHHGPPSRERPPGCLHHEVPHLHSRLDMAPMEAEQEQSAGPRSP